MAVESKRHAEEISIQDRIRRGHAQNTKKGFSFTISDDNGLIDEIVDRISSRIVEAVTGSLKQINIEDKVRKMMHGSKDLRVVVEPTVMRAVVKNPPKPNKGDFYTEPCKKCHKPIRKTGRVGRPPTSHTTCPKGEAA